MEKQLSNIVPIAALGDIILLIREEDIENLNPQCCQLDLQSGKFTFFEDINLPLKFTSFEETPKEAWEIYREEIYARVKDSIIVEILQRFENSNEETNKTDHRKWL